MNSEDRFYLIQRLEEKLDIKFTDIQLDFLMDDRNQLALMSRRAGKDLLLKAKVALSIVEHCLDENPYYIALLCLENTFINASVAGDIERYVNLLLPPHLKALNKTANLSRTGATITIGRVRLSIKPRTRYAYGSVSEVDLVGARFQEIYVNEFGTSLSATKEIIDVSLMTVLNYTDGKVQIAATPRIGISEEDVENTFNDFVIKKAPGLQEEQLDFGTISIDGSVIGTGSISIRDLDSDVLTTVPRQEVNPNSLWGRANDSENFYTPNYFLRPNQDSPTMYFTSARG